MPGCQLTANQNLVSDRRLPELRPHEKTPLCSFLTSPHFVVCSCLGCTGHLATWPLFSDPAAPLLTAPLACVPCLVPRFPVRAPMTSGLTRQPTHWESVMDRPHRSEAGRGQIPCRLRGTPSMTNLGHCPLTLGRFNFYARGNGRFSCHLP